MLSLPIRRYLLCLLLNVTHQATCHAAGPTGEDEAWRALQRGRFALAVSADGQWAAHATADRRLVRVSLRGHPRVEAVQLPTAVHGLDISADGSSVAFVTDGLCVGVAHFATDSIGPPSYHLLARQWAGGDAVTCTRTEPYVEETIRSATVALSPDGSTLALPGAGGVVLVALRNEEVVQSLPGNGEVLDLRFVDGGSKLLIVDAVFGEPWEGEGEPSDIRFAVWDLTTGSLWRWVQTRPPTHLQTADFLHGYDEASGELLTWVTTGHLWNDAHPLELRQINLKDCASQWRSRGHFALTFATSDIAVDARNNRLLLVESKQEVGVTATSTLLLHHLGDGQVLQRWPIDSWLGALAMAPDGETVVAATRANQPSIEEDAYDAPPLGGGELLRFALPAQERDHALRTAAWTESYCRFDGENELARQVDRTGRVIAPAQVIGLPIEPEGGRHTMTGATTEQDRWGDRHPPCSESAIYGEAALSWGVTHGSELWFDHFDRLQRVALDPTEPEDSRTTPRTPTRCAKAIYPLTAWLGYAGDTVTLHPFAHPEQARVLQQRPGWVALNAALVGDRLLVHWVDPARRETLGSGKITLYQREREQPLYEIDGYYYVGDGQVRLEDDQYPQHGWFAANNEPPPTNSMNEYRWSVAHYQSIRVVRAGETLLWDGLCSRQHCPQTGATQVAPLAGSLGAALRRDQVLVYDAQARRRVAEISITAPRRVGYLAGQRILLIENQDEHNGEARLSVFPGVSE
jgi:hypothetical protein